MRPMLSFHVMTDLVTTDANRNRPLLTSDSPVGGNTAKLSRVLSLELFHALKD